MLDALIAFIALLAAAIFTLPILIYGIVAIFAFGYGIVELARYTWSILHGKGRTTD